MRGVSAAGKGAASADRITILTSPATAALYGSAWTVRQRARVIKGIGGEITSWKDLDESEVITVTGIAENVCGSSIDNIEITGA